MNKDTLANLQITSNNLNFKPTWLYIKQHNTTKLKYFGKTVKDPNQYYGSGTFWLRHLKKYGFDITTVWCQLFTNREELINYATSFSSQQDILNAIDSQGNKIWANLMTETGVGPGMPCIETRIKKREQNIGRMVTKETRGKISASRKILFNENKRNNYKNSKVGNKNPAWNGYIITPDGIFDSSLTAAAYYNCKGETILNYCRIHKFNFQQTKHIKDIEKVITISNLEEYKQKTPPSISIIKCKKYGIQGYIKCPFGIFSSSKIAETYCNLNASTIMRRCYNKKYVNWILLQNIDNIDNVIFKKNGL